jgi:hypothetical protein
MQNDAARSVSDVREAVRGYLRERPDAADTLIGVKRWWLPEPLQSVSVSELRHVMEDLILTNEVRRTFLPDGCELYSRAPSAGRDPL